MTWEEEKNLHDCEQLIKEFREKAGLPTTDTDRNRDGDRDGGDEEGDDGQGNEEKEGGRGRGYRRWGGSHARPTGQEEEE